jgi:hypothetical protein
VELSLFALCFVVFTTFSGDRFLRQSAAPHFVYQAKAWLEGRLDLDAEVLPNLEDWACVREVAGQKLRCEGRRLPQDRWYVSFPSFPAVLMLPFVALHGYQFNDTSFGVLCAALAVVAFYSFLRFLSREARSSRAEADNIALALVLAFGSVFFYCALRGEVWFFAEVLGVGLSCLYLRSAVGARRPLLAGLFFSMAVLTRTPLLFTGLFFAHEAFRTAGRAPAASASAEAERWRLGFHRLGQFALGAAPLGLLAAAYNHHRFGRFSEFGHAFLFNNRVNADIDRFGLFDLVYLPRNLLAAFFRWPHLSTSPLELSYDPHGLSLWLTLPLLAFVFYARDARFGRWRFLAAAPMVLGLIAPKLVVGAALLSFVVLLSLPAMAYFGQSQAPSRLHPALWAAVAGCALPGLLYQNDGYMQFGFRFSLDYTPHLLVLFALGSWPIRHGWPLAAALFGGVVNFWGAAAFRGYTELVRGG